MANNNYVRIPDLEIENARLIFRNFSGKPDKFSTQGGIRKFGVIINPEIAESLREEGWNIKMLPPKDEGADPLFYLGVKVQFGEFRKPNVYLITREKKELLTEENVSVIDFADLLNVDLVIQPHYWEVNGKSGINAYLKTGYFEIQSDRFASKYENL